MSRRVAAVVTAIGFLTTTVLAPGGQRCGTLKETDALAEAVLKGRRQPHGELLRAAQARRRARETAELEAVRQAGYRAWSIHHGQQGESS